ncbi:MAG: hypothetical protein GF330_03510 [Candidatus Eisenbacteria bacterium]|nr:hypothetical protein [Candidatus Eisenbacteria bacterium]
MRGVWWRWGVILPGLGALALLLWSGFGLRLPAASAADAADSEMDRRSAEPPETVVYDSWYQPDTPVEFDHAIHVALELDCGGCHHLEGCRECHQQDATTQRVASHKVAIHGACFRCHEQGPRGADCGLCHGAAAHETPQTGVGDSPQRVDDPHAGASATGVSGIALPSESWPEPSEMEPPTPPEQTGFVTPGFGEATVVAFDHLAHAEGYGLDCATCHHFERCSACHAEREATTDVSSAEDAQHASCLGCHEEMGGPIGCDECHRTPGR